MIIYKAKNIINDKVYIGLTTRTLEERKKEHINAAIAGGNVKFYEAIRKYGPYNFEWEIIDEAESLEELQSLEKYHILKSNSYINGYNSNQSNRSHLSPPHRTIKIDEDIHRIFKKYCQDRGRCMGRQLEIWIENKIMLPVK